MAFNQLDRVLQGLAGVRRPGHPDGYCSATPMCGSPACSEAPGRWVWKAYTTPNLVQRWRCSARDGWVAPVCEIDLRRRGDYRYGWEPGEGRWRTVRLPWHNAARRTGCLPLGSPSRMTRDGSPTDSPTTRGWWRRTGNTAQHPRGVSGQDPRGTCAGHRHGRRDGAQLRRLGRSWADADHKTNQIRSSVGAGSPCADAGE